MTRSHSSPPVFALFLSSACFVAATFLLAALPHEAWASGSYVRRAPRPSAVLSSAKYNLGKQIFTGKLEPEQSDPAGADVTERQRGALEKLQDELPPRARSSIDLPGLAGKLSEAQLESLEYYISVRY